MNNILKYLCFVLFGIIIYLLLKNRGKKERFSIGGPPSCISNEVSNCTSFNNCILVDTGIIMEDNICVRQNLNWFSNENQYNLKMIPHIHNQGECSTCGIYSIIYVFECMYNIKNASIAQDSGLSIPNPISISPQSLIDIFGRYNSKINFCGGFGVDYYFNSGATADVTAVAEGRAETSSSDEMCDCPLLHPGPSAIPMCGFNWLCSLDFFNPNTILYNFAKLKTLDENKFSEFNFSYPLIKEFAVRKNDHIIYNTITSCSQRQRILFNESLGIIQADDYLYTNSFNKEDLIDFHFTWDRIFPINFTDIGLDVYINKLKKQLNYGPVIVSIRVDENYESDEPNTILDDEDLRNVITNHSIAIVGYKNNVPATAEVEASKDKIIILNSWNFNESLIEVTFEELYNCHAFLIKENNPIMAFANYNYIYIELFIDSRERHLAYNPNEITSYLTSCGWTSPLILLGVGLVGGSIVAYKKLTCPCNSCTASRSNPYENVDVSIEVSGHEEP